MVGSRSLSRNTGNPKNGLPAHLLNMPGCPGPRTASGALSNEFLLYRSQHRWGSTAPYLVSGRNEWSVLRNHPHGPLRLRAPVSFRTRSAIQAHRCNYVQGVYGATPRNRLCAAWGVTPRASPIWNHDAPARRARRTSGFVRSSALAKSSRCCASWSKTEPACSPGGTKLDLFFDPARFLAIHQL
jgi:hypothetical protein